MAKLNITSLLHPTMMAKISRGMQLARKGEGHLMNGHHHRVYVQNRHGHNIMRIDYRRGKGIFVWGDESRNITAIVQKAIVRHVVTSGA